MQSPRYDPFARGPFSVGERTVQAVYHARDRMFPSETWSPAGRGQFRRSNDVAIPLARVHELLTERPRRSRRLMRSVRRSRRPVAEALHAVALIACRPAMIVCRHTPKSLATSLTVRPSPIIARTALYLCSVTLISPMRGSVTNQPK